MEANWQAEMEGYYTYTAFAKDEVDPQRRNALRGLAAAEKHHARAVILSVKKQKCRRQPTRMRTSEWEEILFRIEHRIGQGTKDGSLFSQDVE